MLAFGYILLVATINVAKAQCGTYSISVNDTNICLNQVVTFKAQNVPGLSEYTWYLGLDTITGKDKDTVSTGYFKTGSFNVRLLIKHKNGDTCSIVKPNFIKVGKAPSLPTVSVDKANLCDVNQKVKLTATGTGVSKWTWNVGQILYKDSTNTVTHKFIRAGYFDVGLTVEDGFGCKSTVLYDSMILVERKPGITLNIGDTSFCDTHTLFLEPTFNMFSQKGFKYDWTLNGSHLVGTANKVPGKLVYSTRGIYTFELDVISPGNCKYHYDFNDTLRIGKIVDFKQTKSFTAPCNSQTYVIKLNNPSQYNSKLEWKFQGDSIIAKSDNNGATITYKTKGNFKYTIKHDDLGCESTFNGYNNVSLRSLLAQFSLNKNCSCNPNDTFQTKENSVGTNSATSYFWEVFDSKDKVIASSNQRQPNFILTKFDVYSIQLNITDTSGCNDSLYKYGIIKMAEPELGLNIEPAVACVGSDVLMSVDSICESDFISALWRIYDKNNTLIKTSTDEFPVFDFDNAGTYSVELEYETAKCTDKVFRSKAFKVVNLQSINYILSDTTPCEGAVINATLKVEPANIKPKVDWTITHASNSNLKFSAAPVQGQENEYLIKPNNTGIYNMKIVVSGGKGCKDSLEVPALIKVSGVKTRFVAQEVTGCLPFNTTLRASITRNEHYDNPTNNTLTYNWQVVPNGNAKLKSPTKSTTEIDIYETGNYNVFLTVVNSDGCSNSFLEEDLFKFDFNALFSVDTVTCQNLRIQPTNNTPGNNVKYEWYCEPSTVTFYTKKTKKEPQFSFDTAGTYTLGLIAISPSGCRDSFQRKITVHPFSFDFSVLNSTPKCTPAQYIFNIKSNNVDTFTWYFGDGKNIITDQKSIAHVYDLSTVKPFRNDFNVSLVGQNNLGCIDTLKKEDLIRVLGPNPTFKFNINQGCNPLSVEFIDSTEQVERFYFNYGDGSSVDSVSFELA